MTCSLFKIPALSAERIDNAYICEARKLVAVTAPDQKVTIYSFQDWTVEPKIIREYKNHVGAILTAAFAPLKYHAYLITAGYDKSLYLYNIDDTKQTEALFSFTQESQEVGYFTTVTFVPTDKTRLVFAVGTSTGHVILFDSQANFEAKTYGVFTSPIKSITGNCNGEIAVAATGASPKVIFDFDFVNAVEVPENGQNLAATIQVKLTSPYDDQDASKLVTACEDQTVGIWDIDSSLRIPKSVQTVELGSNIIKIQWNLSSLSLTVICGKKEDKLNDLKVFRVNGLPSNSATQWRAFPLEIKQD